MTTLSATSAPLVRLALPALLLGAVGIAFAPIFVRLSEVGPIATAFYRCLFALPLLWAWTSMEGRGKPQGQARPSTLRDHLLLAIPGLSFMGDLAVWHISITMTTVANATLLANFAPVFVTLGGWLLWRVKPTPMFLGGMGLAMGGAIVLMGESLTISSEQIMGDVLGVVTAVFYAAYILSIGRLRARFSTSVLMFWSTVYTTAGLLVCTLVAGEGLAIVSLYGLAILVGLAVVSHFGGQSLIAYALAHLPANFSSVSLLLQPAVAAVLAWAILNEPLSPWQGVGGVIILAGIFLARRGSKTPKPPAAGNSTTGAA
ncbi:DMT family transporter [Caenispirillum bisanense]|uniref:EamA-like transporter family protein n=1 Tax=Caenispirillum bisanense TaxID=414052 RepID=A0A286G6J5_9PROT|nr:DMT family transporter [Caenispirillum bisanense]SOD91102.1 EamA-like transporter family protein [Caenispirillum bisanense]